MRLLLHIFFLIGLNGVYAQSDSTILFAEQLKAADIQTGLVNIATQKVVSASRSLQAVEDLPFTVYVISKEEIRNNGYNTLVDALKMVPGIRVSQPGSGVDGETFMMRGLRGNSYTKILVNNVPIKPIGVKGMPIGAQLPIRQAERIEVIFGPAATLYGADASAGVINIILKESERPLFTKADINVGPEGHSSINVLFGGKAGKGRRVLKYNVFGNFTNLDNRLITQEYGDLYRYKSYDPDTVYQKHPNYNSTIESGDYPVISNIPHLSKLFGLQLKYGAFELTIMDMYRRDHSSIGLNPTAFSFENPLNFIGENIQQFHLAYSRKRKKRALNIAFNALFYESDKNSSYRFLNSELNQAFVLAAESDTQPGALPLAERLDLYNNNFITGNRYLYDSKIDLSLDVIWNIKLADKVEWMLGATPRSLISTSEYFLSSPYPVIDDHTVTGSGHQDELEVSGFTQLSYDGIKFKGMAAIQSTYSNLVDFDDGRFFPRLAALYKVTSAWSIRGFYGEAFRTPSTYFSKNSYTINVGNYNWLLLGGNKLRPEITKSFEAGIRWNQSENFYFDFSYFRLKTTNIFRASTQYEYNSFTNNLEAITLGYLNDELSLSLTKLRGIQSTIFWRNIIRKYKLNMRLNLALAEGFENLIGQPKIALREQPKIIGQLRVSFTPWKGVILLFDNLYLSETQNLSAIGIDGREKYNTLPSFYTMDFSLVGRLTDHFQVDFRLKNVFDIEYSGLAATGTSDDLYRNPQSFRTWVLGFSYRME